MANVLKLFDSVLVPNSMPME